MLSPTVRELTFARSDGLVLDFNPGQWVSLDLPLPEGEARRAYSIASAPARSSAFEIAVTRVATGQGSRYLHELTEGAALRVVGPQGFFTRDPHSPHPALFVGTGTGLTPLRSMIVAALGSGSTVPLVLLAGVRTEADRLYHDEFVDYERRYPHFRVHYTLSQPAEPSAGESRGYVQAHVERLWRDLAPSAAEVPHAYVCGLEKMVSAVRDCLRKEMHIERKQVHSERYD